MWLEKIVLLCLSLLALIGTVTIGIVLHEYSHLNDFRQFNVTDEELCGLSLPTHWDNWTTFVKGHAGYYAYRINISENNTQEIIQYQKIDKNTETKAYAISIFVFGFLIFCYWVLSYASLRKEKKILDLGIDGLEKDFYIHQLEEYIQQQNQQNQQQGNEDKNYSEDYNYDIDTQ